MADKSIQEQQKENVVIVPQIRWYHWLEFAFLILVRGSAFLFIGESEKQLPPAAVVALRSFLGMSFLLMINIFLVFVSEEVRSANREIFTNPLTLMHLFVMSLLKSFLPWILLTYAQTKITEGVASILSSLDPVSATLIAMIFLRGKEKVGWKTFFSIILALIGILCVLSPNLTHFEFNEFLHNGAAVLSGVILGSSRVYGKKFLDKKHPVPDALGLISFSLILALASYFALNYSEDHFQFIESTWDLMTTLSVVFLGIFSAGISAIVMFHLLNVMGAIRVAFTSNIVPVVGVLEGIIITHDWNNLQLLYRILQVVGLFLVVVSLTILSISKSKEQQKTYQSLPEFTQDKAQSRNESKIN